MEVTVEKRVIASRLDGVDDCGAYPTSSVKS